MKKTILIATAAILVIVGLLYYKISKDPALQRFQAIKATQFYALSVQEWASDYENHQRALPYPYPHSFDDLSKYGYLEERFMRSLNGQLKVSFFKPPENVSANFILIKAESPSSTWVVRLLDRSINGSGHYLPPVHEELREEAQQDAAANP